MFVSWLARRSPSQHSYNSNLVNPDIQFVLEKYGDSHLYFTSRRCQTCDAVCLFELTRGTRAAIRFGGLLGRTQPHRLLLAGRGASTGTVTALPILGRAIFFEAVASFLLIAKSLTLNSDEIGSVIIALLCNFSYHRCLVADGCFGRRLRRR